MSHKLLRFLTAFCMLLVFLLPSQQVAAHPHMFVQARAELVFDDDGYLTHIRHKWLFDDLYTAYAVQGLDVNQNGFFEKDELAELAEINIQGLSEYGYFTFGDDSQTEIDFSQPFEPSMKMVNVAFDDYWLISEEDKQAIAEEVAAGRSQPDTSPVSLVELSFSLPLKKKIKADKPITLDVYDPTYYIDFKWPKGDTAVSLSNAPGKCSVELVHPPELDGQIAAQLATIGADQRNVPEALQSYTSALVNQVIVSCDGAVTAAATTGNTKFISEITPKPVESAPATAEDAVAVLAQGGDAMALSSVSERENVGAADADLRGPDMNIFQQGMATITRLQNEFYLKLTSALRNFRNNPSAGWLLMLISFAYGVFHAAGPGHGKAVISSYVIADEQTLKKGIALSFASAFAQAVTAIALVGGAGVLLHLTSTAINATARWFELGSYVLVFVLGLYLVWQRVLKPWFGKKPASSCGHSHDHDHDHHHHDHEHAGHGEVCSSCGHAHAPDPKMVQNSAMTLTSIWSIILAVGLRPCTGALIVLAFAFSQGMIWAGVASTLVMALGTGITVSVLASLAVLSREVALRIWGADSQAGMVILRGFEVVGALTILLMGTLMLIVGLNGGATAGLF
ncbi:ABC-type nickel/cobalt efflux system, permease component RcnA [Pseudovibrio ascidiaceicola]|uniref:ABC-type nickel/cobalt efflux system, permease component RcnA n=1 Tax=Pseudovibrio ascidiaceicola TaxID=285279 RepID=A0A1I4AEB0_9HYPH|nr:DUF1007 family protein [Pseudovibrio ascidiaceicola]SFK54407.1 ABC-type nickel/cobalt efflux system, permease component RcnA [Pseudovibrio ascidiaceicola]